MESILEWVCEKLLFDIFELSSWLHIINSDDFDIIKIREKTQLL